jgi:hypothetical protein
MNRERWPTWGVGGLYGSIIGVAVLIFGTPAAAISLAVALAGTALTRAFAFPSGIFIGAGVTWLLLALRATLACEARNQLPSSACVAPDPTGLFVMAAVLIGVGAALGVVAWLRRRSMLEVR